MIQTYPVEQRSPPIGHIEITTNIKRNTNAKDIAFQNNIAKNAINLYLIFFSEYR